MSDHPGNDGFDDVDGILRFQDLTDLGIKAVLRIFRGGRRFGIRILFLMVSPGTDVIVFCSLYSICCIAKRTPCKHGFIHIEMLIMVLRSGSHSFIPYTEESVDALVSREILGKGIACEPFVCMNDRAFRQYFAERTGRKVRCVLIVYGRRNGKAHARPEAYAAVMHIRAV